MGVLPYKLHSTPKHVHNLLPSLSLAAHYPLLRPCSSACQKGLRGKEVRMQKKLTRNPKDRGKNKPRQKAKDKKEKQPFLVCLSHFVRGRHYGWSSSLTSFLLGLFSTNTLTLASTDLLTTDTATRPVQGSGLEVTRHRPDTACSCATGRCLPSLPGGKSPGTSGAMRLSSWAPHWCQPAAIPPT